ncbi:hypothetical protein BLS_004586 [Venturia inaequalis]|uniref:Uncharacterized protein n=1 Tax=Venturia inaequalis TaxID=5025 RepID=A0A8H3UK90_VENIN|nr:hypothetical protein BLS_004586 [Venturia inaequalis]RDI87223.1 hypothetical protein Vi05172_g2673 [Venturia inaequalis]
MTDMKEAISFLSLPLELRQKILLLTLTDDKLFKKDIRFNHLLSEFSTTIRKNSTTSHNGTQCTKNNPNVPDSDTLMTKIFSYVHVDETIFKSAP